MNQYRIIRTGKLLAFLVLFLINFSCQVKKKEGNFKINRGINISQVLSQTTSDFINPETLFTERDVIFLSELGFDHLRIPVDENHLWDEKGYKIEENFKFLHKFMQWCINNNLRVILDLHSTRSHSFNKNDNLLWRDIEAQDRFISLWSELSAEFKNYPISSLAYELLNEPVAESGDNWNSLLNRTIAQLRINEPNRYIVIGSNLWQSPSTFMDLKIPDNDKNIILSFHFYEPFLLTHYKAVWTDFANVIIPVNYPGTLIAEEVISHYNSNDSLNNFIEKYNGFFSKDTLATLLQAPIMFAKKKGLQLHCGEFGCLPTVDRTSRLKWYSDVISIFNENNIAWTKWDYRGGFTIFNTSTNNPDYNLISILLNDK